MGAFLCSISERDWEIALRKGIYGNKAGNVRDGGDYKLFGPSTQYSIIRDLAGMRSGDLLFFHVVRPGRPSTVHGAYVVRQEPLYAENKVWEDQREKFPYRFLFEPHPKFKYLAEHDANINVIDFYELIEQRKIWTLATLENEINLEARSVRKIEGSTESNEIIKILHRDFNQRKSKEWVTFNLVDAKEGRPIRDVIGDVGRYENSIKALLMYWLGHKDKSLSNLLGDVTDFMNEVFIAQTTRKSMDILCINESKAQRVFTIVEVKTARCDEKSLSQVLYYMDLFKRRGVMDLNKDKVVGSLIGKSFSRDVVDYAKKRNAHGVNGKLLLIAYEPNRNGKDATLRQVS